MAAGSFARRSARRINWRVILVAGFLVGGMLSATVLIRRWFTWASSPVVVPRLPASPVNIPLPRLTTNQPPDPLPASMPDSPDRVADARARRSAGLAAMFVAAGVPYPARELHLRVYKREGQLELWARPLEDHAPFRLVHTYPILCASGRLGPKRREGDGQIPEGFYVVDRFNSRSLFHLSLGLNYPNAADRILTTDPAHTGSDVFIHGGAASVGCLAMGDTAAEEIYLAASDARETDGRGLSVWIFPCRMNATNWREVLAPAAVDRPELASLWQSLREGYDAFERTHRLPTIQVDARGGYVVAAPDVTSVQPL